MPFFEFHLEDSDYAQKLRNLFELALVELQLVMKGSVGSVGSVGLEGSEGLVEVSSHVLDEEVTFPHVYKKHKKVGTEKKVGTKKRFMKKEMLAKIKKIKNRKNAVKRARDEKKNVPFEEAEFSDDETFDFENMFKYDGNVSRYDEKYIMRCDQEERENVQRKQKFLGWGEYSEERVPRYDYLCNSPSSYSDLYNDSPSYSEYDGRDIDMLMHRLVFPGYDSDYE